METCMTIVKHMKELFKMFESWIITVKMHG
jgi:hypothetical protein